jgi:uncharacterized membrane protein
MMDSNLLEDFKGRVTLSFDPETCEHCGQGVTIYLRTTDDAEKLAKTLRHIVDKSEHKVFMHTLLRSSRSAFYQLAMFSFLYLIFSLFNHDYNPGDAMIVCTVVWGLMFIFQGVSLNVFRKIDERKKLKNEIATLTGEK